MPPRKRKKRSVSDKKAWHVLSRGCDGKRAFAGQAEAEEECERMWEEQRVDLVAYRCRSCSKWHLANR
jgi:hypothetical protein